MSAEFTTEQLARELGRQLSRIEELERALAGLEQRQNEADDEITSLALALRNAGPSSN